CNVKTRGAAMRDEPDNRESLATQNPATMGSRPTTKKTALLRYKGTHRSGRPADKNKIRVQLVFLIQPFLRRDPHRRKDAADGTVGRANLVRTVRGHIRR